MKTINMIQFEGEVLRILGRGDVIVIHDEEPPKIGQVIQVNGQWREVVGIESMGGHKPWGVVLRGETKEGKGA